MHPIPAKLMLKSLPQEMGLINPDCLVLIPTYNEAQNIRPITEGVLANGPRFGVLIIDDNSPDGTGRLADELATARSRIKVLHRPEKQGLRAAYVAGFQQALAMEGVNYIATMDADLSHNPENIPRLLSALEDGLDMVIGSRYVRGGGVRNWSLGRRILSRCGGIYARSLLRLDIADPTSGFNIFRRQALGALELQELKMSGYGFLIEVKYEALRVGLKLTEVPIIFTERSFGKSKMDLKIALEAIAQIYKLARRKKVGK